MKNSKHVFVLSLILWTLSAKAQIGQEPVFQVQYGENPKLHARSISVFKNKLFIAASDGKMYTYDLKTGQSSSSDSLADLEYRDLIVTRRNILLLASGESSATVSIDRKTGGRKITPFPNQFLDGIERYKKTIFLMGDPIDGKFNLFQSSDFGVTWNKTNQLPASFEGEAGFAASGSNLRMISEKEWLFVTGGLQSRLFHTEDAGQTWTDVSMGFRSCESCGAYSFTVLPDNTIIAVGGDYTKANASEGTCKISQDGGKTWKDPEIPLTGYRSHVIYYQNQLFACGTNGLDVSEDDGKTWRKMANGNFFCMTVYQNQLLVSSTNGHIYFYEIPKRK